MQFGFIGVGLMDALGQAPAYGLLAGSAGLLGGHGTVLAWAPVIAERFHVTGAAELGAATATLGLIVGGVLGGPVGEAFPEGVVVIQDDVNDVGTQNFKYIDWRDIRAALNL